MKIKEASIQTGLTERTIRFYQQKELLSPASYRQNGKNFYDYSPEDIVRLNRLALLRRAGFSVEEIRQLFHEEISAQQLLQHRMTQLREEQTRSAFQMDLLQPLEHQSFSDRESFLAELEKAAKQQSCTVPLSDPEWESDPDFSKFDPETPEEKQNGYLDFLISQRKREKREKKLLPIQRLLRRILPVAGVIALLFALSCIPRPVSRKWEGVVFTPLTQVWESRSVSLEGTVTHRLFSHPRFTGYLRIEGIDFTQNNKVTLDFFGGIQNPSWLIYTEIAHQGQEVVPVQHSLGMVYTSDERFQELVIDMRFWEESVQLFVTAEQAGVQWGPVLCAPTENLIQAQEMAQAHIHQPALGEEAVYFTPAS